ncbi:MAG: glycosyltransferase [Gemmatimonadetes bacterium]|nr:glycosyltransferase [Gemmatimonadota bacterium]
MTDLLAYSAVAAYGLTLALLLPFAGHRLHLWALSRRPAPPLQRQRWRGELPAVTVQLPVYNEKHVIERLIDAAARLEYPRHRLEIQVLDDSTDETRTLASVRVAHWRSQGILIQHVHRTRRVGYKAGALAAGMARARGEFLLVLDADFVPQPELLHRLLLPFQDPGVGMVQARWDHLNEYDSWLTRAQAVLLDGHFSFEQGGRFRGGRFFNFNGTAGMWRKAALEEAGGWQFDTLTEDLDVSYRAQLQGWRFAYLGDVGVPAELPGTLESFLTQQRRWAQGGIQTARKVLPSVFRAGLPARVKWEAFVHLCGHLAHPLTLFLGLLVLPAAAARRHLGLDALWWLDLALFTLATGPFIWFYWHAARTRAHRDPFRRSLQTIALGVGLSLFLTRSVLRGVGSARDPFLRTPKRGGRRREQMGCSHGSASDYETSGWTAAAVSGVALGVLLGIEALFALGTGLWASAPFIGLFAFGFLRLGLSGSPSHQPTPGLSRQEQPSREPDHKRGPTGLWPRSRSQVVAKSPIAEEYEPA